MIVLDTNALLRFLLQDDLTAAEIVEERMLQNKYLVPIEVFAEVVYVSNKVYRIERSAVARMVRIILSDDNSFVPSRQVVEEAVHVFAETSFDFVDCLLIGYSRVDGHRIFTFDKKLKNRLSSHAAD